MRTKLLLLLFAVVAVGCGGGGSGTSTPSPFAGNFIGTWTEPSTPASGTANVTIATNGAVTGTIHDNGTNTDGTLTGTISAAGNVNATVQYPGNPPSSLVGTLTLNQQNHLVGTVIQDGTFSVTFDLVKQ